VSRDDLGEFVQAVEQAREWPELSSDQQTLIAKVSRRRRRPSFTVV
jgi:hypothetical protein